MTSLKAVCCLTALAGSLAPPGWAGSSIAASPSAVSTSGFKITYALKTRRHGAIWNGGVENASRVRSVQGWHLHDADRLRPPNLWNIQLHSVGGAIAAPGVILDLGGPAVSRSPCSAAAETLTSSRTKFPSERFSTLPASAATSPSNACRSPSLSHPLRTKTTARRCCEHAPGPTGSLGSPTRLVPAMASITKVPTKSWWPTARMGGTGPSRLRSLLQAIISESPWPRTGRAESGASTRGKSKSAAAISTSTHSRLTAMPGPTRFA